MQKKYLALAAVSVMLLNPLNAAAEGKNGVAAVVNGQKITVAEIREAYNANPDLKKKVPFDEFYPKAVEVYVNGAVLYQAAQKDKVTSTAEYKQQLKLAQEELARKIYLEKKVEKKVTPKAIEEFYKGYKANFKPEKEIKASHILVKDEATAQEIIAKLKKGEKFNTLADKYSLDKQAELGYFNKGVMVPEFWDAANAMKKGTYSQKPVKTQFGYHIIKVEDIRDTKPLPLNKVEPQIKARLTQNAIAETFEQINKNTKIERYDLNGKPMKAAELK